MIVDDDMAASAALQAVLRMAGYRVLCAADGQVALNMAGATLPDLIVTDWMMPGMDGVELCKRLRKDGILCGIPLILMSADAPLAIGCWDEYFPKPPEMPQLLRSIDALLAAQKNFSSRRIAGAPKKADAPAAAQRRR
jgi:DNA-binding response OmpR family regulator